jgi:hypothetical protein
MKIISSSDRLRFHCLDDPGVRVPHDRPTGSGPQVPELLQDSLGVSDRVKFQVDHHEIGIRYRPVDVISTNSGCLPADRVAVESALPAFKVRDGVLDSQDWHF